MSKLMPSIAVFVAATLVLSACAGSDPEASGDQELVLAIREGDNNIAPLLVELWNEENPDSTITIETLPGNADQVRQQLTLELDAGSNTFDVLGLDVIWTGEFAENEWIENIDDLRADVEGKVWEGSLASGQYQGEQYALPLLLGAGLLYYRSDLIEEPPGTWDELTEQALAVASAQDMDAYAGQGAGYEGLVVNYLELLWGAGGDLFNEDQSEVVYGDNDAALTALEFMKTSYENGLYMPGFNTMTEAEARGAFETGETVFMRHWVAPFRAIRDAEGSVITDKFNIAPLPTFEGAGTASALGGLNLSVSSFSENKELAKEFVAWASSDEDAQALLGNNGIGPVLKSTYDSPEFSDDPFFTTLRELLPDAKPRPPVPAWNEISVAMQRNVFDAYTGQMSTEDAVAAIRAALEDTLE